jgi:hypothetical protein
VERRGWAEVSRWRAASRRSKGQGEGASSATWLGQDLCTNPHHLPHLASGLGWSGQVSSQQECWAPRGPLNTPGTQ